MSTVATVQQWIEAREAVDAITYGIRSIDVCRSVWAASECHAAQIRAACQAATRVTDRFVAVDPATTRRALVAARQVAVEQVKVAAAERKAVGSARQIRLALAA